MNWSTRQEAMAELAACEAGKHSWPIKIDHEEPACFVGTDKHGLLFPWSWVREMGRWQQRPVRYFFYGLETPKRQWVRQYIGLPRSHIQFCDTGRVIDKQYMDSGYTIMMTSAKFALCPEGDFGWTYRFAEACFCGAIPIVEKRINWYGGFEFFTINDTLVDEDRIREHNWRKAIERFTINA